MKSAEHTEANLINLTSTAFRTEALRFGRDDDALRQPLVRLFAPPLRAADPKFTLKLLYETVLRRVLVYNDGSHLPAQLTVSVHGVHIGNLLSAPYHRF